MFYLLGALLLEVVSILLLCAILRALKMPLTLNSSVYDYPPTGIYCSVLCVLCLFSAESRATGKGRFFSSVFYLFIAALGFEFMASC
jgi:hypothetical protein